MGELMTSGVHKKDAILESSSIDMSDAENILFVNAGEHDPAQQDCVDLADMDDPAGVLDTVLKECDAYGSLLCIHSLEAVLDQFGAEANYPFEEDELRGIVYANPDLLVFLERCLLRGLSKDVKIHAHLDAKQFSIFPIADIKDLFDGTVEPFEDDYSVGKAYGRIERRNAG